MVNQMQQAQIVRPDDVGTLLLIDHWPLTIIRDWQLRASA